MILLAKPVSKIVCLSTTECAFRAHCVPNLHTPKMSCTRWNQKKTGESLRFLGFLLWSEWRESNPPHGIEISRFGGIISIFVSIIT